MPRRKKKRIRENRTIGDKKMQKLGVYITAGLKEDLRDTAKIKQKSMSKMVEEAVSKELYR